MRHDNEVTEPEDNSRNSREARKAARKRKILRNRLIFSGIILLIVFAVCFRIFVVVRVINTSNTTPYDTDRLLSVISVKNGTFLLSVNADDIKDELRLLYPYVGDVSVKIHFPDSVDINFEGAEAVYSVSADGYYLYTDENFRVLEKAVDTNKNCIAVIGADITEYAEGETLTTDVFPSGSVVQSISELAKENGLGSPKQIDLTKTYNVTAVFDNGISVVFGDGEDLERKFETLKYILNENGTVSSEINVSNYRKAKYKLVTEPSSEAQSFTDEEGDVEDLPANGNENENEITPEEN